MFSENDRISQRQMERQIVLVLLCPAFWQLAAYGASDGLPGMAGIFVGYGLCRWGKYYSGIYLSACFCPTGLFLFPCGGQGTDWWALR